MKETKEAVESHVEQNFRMVFPNPAPSILTKSMNAFLVQLIYSCFLTVSFPI